MSVHGKRGALVVKFSKNYAAVAHAIPKEGNVCMARIPKRFAVPGAVHHDNDQVFRLIIPLGNLIPFTRKQKEYDGQYDAKDHG
jgi:hypothetical protein